MVFSTNPVRYSDEIDCQVPGSALRLEVKDGQENREVSCQHFIKPLIPKPPTGSAYRLRYAKVEFTKIKTHNCHNCVKFENMSCGKR